MASKSPAPRFVSGAGTVADGRHDTHPAHLTASSASLDHLLSNEVTDSRKADVPWATPVGWLYEPHRT